MRLIILLIIGASIYWYYKNHSKSDNDKTDSILTAEARLEQNKRMAIEAARQRYRDRINGISSCSDEEKDPMYAHMARFLNAVKLTSESGGQGTIMLTMNDDQNAFSINAHYCNYSCVSCMDKLLYDGALNYPGMTMVEGGDEDSFNYNIKNIDVDGYSFSAKYLIREIVERMPEATITTNAERPDFISVSFRT